MPSDTLKAPLSSDPKVSIVIPVYNGKNYLVTAIESALNQTYKNIEVIVVNDGSDDGGATQQICEQYSEKIIYHEQQNVGVSGALNKALELASGDYFCWLSHDDEYLPDKTQKQLDFLQQFERNDVIAFSNYYLIDDMGEVWHESNLDEKLLRKKPGIALLRGMVNGCSLMIPMPLLRRNLPFDIALRYTQDYEMWDKLRKEAQFVLLPETLIRYRVHHTQDSNSTNPKLRQESDNLWIRMMSGRSDAEKVILNGSRKKYYSELRKFLETTSYEGARNYAHERSIIDLEDITVSVIIPFYNNVELVKKAVQSVVLQTHRNLDIIIINDGSTDDITQIHKLISNERRLRLLETENRGPGYARNLGLEKAKGEYIAFLDSDDEFMPNKISHQLSQMMDEGAIFSHTSYEVIYPEGREGIGLVKSGNLTGDVYPNLIGSCRIATPTVMVHRITLKMGLKFPTDSPLVEDVRAWIWLAQKTPLLGINEFLSKVTWRDDSAALNIKKGIAGISLLMDVLQENPLHKLQHYALAELEKMYELMTNMHKFAIAKTDDTADVAIVNLDNINIAFNSTNSSRRQLKSKKQIYEVGQHENPTSKNPYALHKR